MVGAIALKCMGRFWGLGVLALVGCASGPSYQGVDGPDAGPDLVAAGADDGAPVRQACTSSFGHGITSAYGRLDGQLISIVAPGHRGCNGDSDHLHLQVEASGAAYDIAITVVDMNGGMVDYLALDRAPLGDPFVEGWHSSATLDYPTIGAHATDFAATLKATLAADVSAELANANHVSVFASGYTDGSGAHKVHRNGGGTDGALVIRPLSGLARVLLFHFGSQSF